MSVASAATVIGVSLKLYLDVAETELWARRVAEIVRWHPAIAAGSVGMFVLPSLPALPGVREALAGTGVEVGAQDLFWEERGPFTGAVSGADLRSIGCTMAEIGHLERRRVFGEDDRVINLKTAAAYRTGLTPVLCVGEARAGDAASAGDEVLAQLESALYGIPRPDGSAELVVAYEPQWAIGATEAADAGHVAAVVRVIRDALRAHPWLAAARVIYGGSAGPGVLTDLGAEVDGLFLGRYAHDPDALERVLDETVAVT